MPNKWREGISFHFHEDGFAHLFSCLRVQSWEGDVGESGGWVMIEQPLLPMNGLHIEFLVESLG